ncbi:hypothetical protein [Paraburkholderia bonniea]|uniref:hypothetical protein n=1 Tax=Paraburkholderia bonniea TaxID=2152891 RepID=UPI0012924757|nr:hypothetical protein [Paraburkholderia bonniea]
MVVGNGSATISVTFSTNANGEPGVRLQDNEPGGNLIVNNEARNVRQMRNPGKPKAAMVIISFGAFLFISGIATLIADKILISRAAPCTSDASSASSASSLSWSESSEADDAACLSAPLKWMMNLGGVGIGFGVCSIFGGSMVLVKNYLSGTRDLENMPLEPEA